jgi:3-oxoacyl-[acyl-carrier protein] reductase
MKLSFQGKRVAVSGVGLGFGRAIALQFADLGAEVYGCDIRQDLLDTLAGSPVQTKNVDLIDRAAGAMWIKAIEDSGGPVDILVNNLGGLVGASAHPIDQMPDEDWDRIFAVNIHASFVLARAVTAGMKARGSGRIINISSGAGLQASLTGNQAYCSSKHAVIGLTRQLAHELGQFGILVNSVAPGFVVTSPDTSRQWESYSAERQDALINGVAMRRLGRPEDIANAVLFFASDLAGFVNGQVLSVDGGR